MSSTVVVYYNNITDENLSKVYIFSLNNTIIDIKNNILADFPKEGFNYIDLDYVSERVYKEIGKYSFNRGIIPRTMDIINLEQFTNGGKTYHFYIHYDNYEVIKNEKPKLSYLANRGERLLKNDDKPAFNYENDFPTLSFKN